MLPKLCLGKEHVILSERSHSNVPSFYILTGFNSRGQNSNLNQSQRSWVPNKMAAPAAHGLPKYQLDVTQCQNLPTL